MNLIKLRNKVKQNEKVCDTQNYIPQPRSRSKWLIIGLSLTNHVSTITKKTAEVNLSKFHTAVKHNKKECQA